jgi:hypothetical protein
MPIYKVMLFLQHVNMLVMMLKFAMVLWWARKMLKIHYKRLPWTKKLGKEGKSGKTLMLLWLIYTLLLGL